VPPLALLWMQAAASAKHDLSSLKVLQVGGAKFMPEAARRVRAALGCQLQQVFGMAEGLVNYTRLDDPDEIVVETQGRPISPHDEVLIVDDAGNPVPEGEAGNLLTRGPYTIRAYHSEPGANARSFTEDGFYRTGDVVKRTPEGYLVVQGRATDHINRAGEKVSAEEIEDHLLAHPNVFDAAVVSIPDEFLGERSCAFIIAQGEKPKGAAIKAWMRTRNVAEFKVPDQIQFVEAFETTAVGKISRKELRARLRQAFLDSQAEKG
jgi:2,3-dihydroxybenzoate-AMP ligase